MRTKTVRALLEEMLDHPLAHFFGVESVEYAEAFDNYNEDTLRNSTDCDNTRSALLLSVGITVSVCHYDDDAVDEIYDNDENTFLLAEVYF